MIVLATSSQNILRLTFETSGGSTSSITLPSPRTDVTATEVEAAMDLIITKNIFTGSGGDFTAKRDIKIIDTTTNDLYEPA